MRMYARQVNPEYQESPLFMGEEFFPDNIAVFGNRDFNEHMPDVVQRVREVLDAGELAEALEDIEAGRADPVFQFTEPAEACTDFLHPEHKKTYNAQDARTLKMAVKEYDKDENNALCIALSVVTGKKWEHKTLCGCCQSDWVEVLYPVDEWNREALAGFEAEYFNTGTEWIIHDGNATPETPEDVEGYSLYCRAWCNEDLKNEIAAATGCTPEDVTLYRWTGTRKINVYEEV